MCRGDVDADTGPSVTVNALAGTGAVQRFTCASRSVLGAGCGPSRGRDAKETALAEGRRKLVPYAGPSELPCRDRVGFAGALVMGDESLSGVIPTEGKADRKI